MKFYETCKYRLTFKNVNINRGTKEKSLMTISIDSEKSFDKIQHQFMITILSKVGIKRKKKKNFNQIKGICDHT